MNSIKWQSPSAQEVKLTLLKANLTVAEFARIIKSNQRHVLRWLDGHTPIPYLPFHVLAHLADNQSSFISKLTTKQIDLKSVINKKALVNQNWEIPTPSEIRHIVNCLGMSTPTLKHLFNVNQRTVRRWLSGETPINYIAWMLLVYKASGIQMWQNISDHNLIHRRSG